MKEKHIKTFEAIAEGFALEGDHVVLMECTLKKAIPAGQKVAVMCLWVEDKDDKHVLIYPAAMMFDEDASKFLTPPVPIKDRHPKIH